jgi:hypothetical protein
MLVRSWPYLSVLLHATTWSSIGLDRYSHARGNSGCEIAMAATRLHLQDRKSFLKIWNNRM